MAASRLSVTETIADVIARRPVLRPILKAFEPLLEARASLPAPVKPLLRKRGLCLPEMRTERAAQGVPLLSDVSLQGIGKAVRAAGKTMPPLLAEQNVVKPYMEKLRVFFLGSEEGNASETASLDALAESVLRADDLTLERTAVGIGVPPEVLLFAFGFMLGPVLRALVEMGTPGAKTPWDAEGAWRQGYCPVCGSFPSIACLDRPVFEEKNAFLAGGGGLPFLPTASWKYCGNPKKRVASGWIGAPGARCIAPAWTCASAIRLRIWTRWRLASSTSTWWRPRRGCARSIPRSGIRFSMLRERRTAAAGISRGGVARLKEVCS